MGKKKMNISQIEINMKTRAKDDLAPDVILCFPF